MPVNIIITKTSPEGEALYQLGAVTLTDEAWEKVSRLLRAVVLTGEPGEVPPPDPLVTALWCRCGHPRSCHTAYLGCRFADSEGLCLCSSYRASYL